MMTRFYAKPLARQRRYSVVFDDKVMTVLAFPDDHDVAYKRYVRKSRLITKLTPSIRVLCVRSHQECRVFAVI